VLTAIQAVALPIRIQPLGDSITIGARGFCVSYRYPLFERLATAGIDFEYVGSVVDQGAYPAVNGRTMPPRHEAHWGYKIEEINAGLAEWMSSYEFDWSLVFLGTNYAFGETASSMQSKMSTTIDLLRAKNPNVVVFLGLLYQSWGLCPSIRAAFAKLAETKTTAASPVIAAWPPAGWDSSIHTDDQSHPNEAGAELLAGAWFDAIQAYLNGGSTESRESRAAARTEPPIEITRGGSTCVIALPVQQAHLEIIDFAGRLVSVVDVANGRALLGGMDLGSQVRFLRMNSPGYTATVPLR
jgi:hypothetical protein